MGEEHLRQARVVGVGGGQERREAALLADVRVGAGVEQRMHGVVVERGGGGVQRADPLDVLRVAVGRRTRREQRPHRRAAAEERGQVQRGEPLGRPGGQRVRVVAEPVGAAERRRLEDVELRPRGQQRLAGLRLRW